MEVSKIEILIHLLNYRLASEDCGGSGREAGAIQNKVSSVILRGQALQNIQRSW